MPRASRGCLVHTLRTEDARSPDEHVQGATPTAALLTHGLGREPVIALPGEFFELFRQGRPSGLVRSQQPSKVRMIPTDHRGLAEVGKTEAGRPFEACGKLRLADEVQDRPEALLLGLPHKYAQWTLALAAPPVQQSS